MKNPINNIYENIPSKIPQELFEIIAENDDIKIERIISEGHSTPDDFWYDQEKNEFVILLKGSAEVQFENDRIVKLTEGDYLLIKKNEKHRVSLTDKNVKTIWLAVHY